MVLLVFALFNFSAYSTNPKLILVLYFPTFIFKHFNSQTFIFLLVLLSSLVQISLYNYVTSFVNNLAFSLPIYILCSISINQVCFKNNSRNNIFLLPLLLPQLNLTIFGRQKTLLGRSHDELNLNLMREQANGLTIQPSPCGYSKNKYLPRTKDKLKNFSRITLTP